MMVVCGETECEAPEPRSVLTLHLKEMSAAGGHGLKVTQSFKPELLSFLSMLLTQQQGALTALLWSNRTISPSPSFPECDPSRPEEKKDALLEAVSERESRTGVGAQQTASTACPACTGELLGYEAGSFLVPDPPPASILNQKGSLRVTEQGAQKRLLGNRGRTEAARTAHLELRIHLRAVSAAGKGLLDSRVFPGLEKN